MFLSKKWGGGGGGGGGGTSSPPASYPPVLVYGKGDTEGEMLQVNLSGKWMRIIHISYQWSTSDNLVYSKDIAN